MTETDKSKEKHTCPFCKEDFIGWGNNPEPVLPWADGANVCCDDCNSTVVVTARLKNISNPN